MMPVYLHDVRCPCKSRSSTSRDDSGREADGSEDRPTEPGTKRRGRGRRSEVLNVGEVWRTESSSEYRRVFERGGK